MYCYGKTPWETMVSTKHLALEKQLEELPWQNSKQDVEPETEPVESTPELLAETRTQQAPNLDEMNLKTKTNF